MESSGLDFKKLRSLLSLQYGIELDDTSITILYTLKQDLHRQFKKMDRVQEEMAAQIKLSKKSLQVDDNHPRWQAFWHGMGQWGLGLCLAVLITAVMLLVGWNNSGTEKEQLQRELTWYKEQYQAAQEAIKRNPKPKSK
jgi:hypothetical protein